MPLGMSLAEYKRKRSFSRTPEPEGKQARSGSQKNKLLFVVQKHHASHLHYDFRLELRGALKSWAVPKGPSMNPEDKRLAMLVEDHPFDYKDFEGVIPKGNYGAGTVIIWDQGTYEPAERAANKAEQEKLLLKQFYSGQMKIRLKGKKLKGEFVLVRSENREENAWLLIKKKDADAGNIDITKKDRSVVSGKTLDQVAKDKKSKQWISNRAANGELKEERRTPKKTVTKATKKPAGQEKTRDENKTKPARKALKVEKQKQEPAQIIEPNLPGDESIDFDEMVAQLLTEIKKKKRAPMPQNIKPMLATLTDEPFDKPDWIYEVKWDGYRALAYLDKGKVELKSRNNNSFNEKFFPVYEALKEWSVKAVVDGEIVVVNEKGLSTFSELEGWQAVEDGQLEYYVFDILWLNGIDLMGLPLIERRRILQQLVPDNEIIRYSESFAANGTEFFASAEKLGIEGIVAKRADSIYQPDVRTKDWLKIKTEQRHDAIIAGYTRNAGTDKLFSALILGIYDDGKLKFIGQAGTGFTKKSQAELIKKLKPIETKECPFEEEPEINRPTRFRPNPPKTEVFWVEPQLVCEVKYQELKPEGIMRHASFQGLREDKRPREVEEEEPVPAPVEKPAKKSAKTKKASPKTSSKKPSKQFLDPKSDSEDKTINNHLLKFSNLNKIYWPAEKLTKRDLLNYYHAVAPFMLPYMKDRPQSLNRHPNGIKGKNFYQKKCWRKSRRLAHHSPL